MGNFSYQVYYYFKTKYKHLWINYSIFYFCRTIEHCPSSYSTTSLVPHWHTNTKAKRMWSWQMNKNKCNDLYLWGEKDKSITERTRAQKSNMQNNNQSINYVSFSVMIAVTVCHISLWIPPSFLNVICQSEPPYYKAWHTHRIIYFFPTHISQTLSSSVV